MSFEITKKSKVDAIDYLSVLMEEVAIQRSRLQPEDTGHIHTTISVLEPVSYTHLRAHET